MNVGGCRGDNIGHSPETPCWLDLWHPAQLCVSPHHMQTCIPFRSVGNSYQVSSKLWFPQSGLCVTQVVGILHGRWGIRFTSPRTASNRAQPLWHLWTGRPCRKKGKCVFWRSELQLIPPNPFAARHTRSLLGQFQPFKTLSLARFNRW